MNRKLTAVLLIVAAVVTNIAFTVLGTVFNYPDVLKEPVEEILAEFRAHQTTVTAWFALMALSAALMAPIAVGVGRLSNHPAMRAAVPVGIAAAVVQVIGLARWPLLVPGFAADAASADPAVAAAARDSFLLAHQILGNLIGETFGYLLTAAWTLLVVVALRRGFAGLWFSLLGAVSAVLIVAGALSPLNLPLIDDANFIGYVLWSVWLVIFAVLLLLGRPRTGTTPTERARLSRPLPLPFRKVMISMNPSTPNRHALISWLIWTAGFLAFPDRRCCRRCRRRSRRQPHRRCGGRPHHRCRHRHRTVAGQPRPAPARALDPGHGARHGCRPAARRDRRRLPDLACRRRRHGGTDRRAPRRRPNGGATGSDPTTLVVGRGHASAVGARLDRHHPGRDPRRGAVHHLRRQRCRHLLRPLRRPPAAAAPRSRRPPKRQSTTRPPPPTRPPTSKDTA